MQGINVRVFKHNKLKIANNQFIYLFVQHHACLHLYTKEPKLDGF